MASYLRRVLAVAAALLVAAASINVFVDPFAVYGSPRIEGFNAAKPALATRQRIFKSVTVARGEWSALILGTSRAEIAFDPRHPFFGGRPAFNAAMGGEGPEESARLFESAADRGRLEQVLLVVDFPIFNAHLRNLPGYTESNFAPWRPLQLAFSMDTLEQSLRTPLAQRSGSVAPRVWSWEMDGRVVFAPSRDPRALAHESERGYLHANFFPQPSREFALEHGAVRPLDHVRRMIARAHADGIRLTIAMPPAHARHWEVVAVAGMWEKFEAWKRRVVAINEEQARAAGKPPFPLWDFTSFEGMWSEPYPPLGQTHGAPRWVSDSSHATPEAGARVLDRMMAPGAHAAVDATRGVALDGASIDAHLAGLREERARWRRANAGDVREIEDIAAAAPPPIRERMRATSPLR